MRKIICAKVNRIFLIVWLISAVSNASSIDEIKENNKIISGYYKQAMDAFYKADYTAAIIHWKEILNIDAMQKQAEKMIELARNKMSERIKPLQEQVTNLIKQGSYNDAFVKVKELTALDVANQKWQTLSSKLEKISQIVPEMTKKEKVPTLARNSINAYLSDNENERLALNASRYAYQLDQSYPKISELKEFMESEYKSFAQTERLIIGVNLVEQKLQASLSNIYDGKYDRAILECNDIIELEPSNVMAMKRCGSAYYVLGNKKRAKEVWSHAAKIAPNDRELKKFMKMK